ncbi:hypothetical protein ACFFUB_00440 [Algimonas porphyrae]|uniref:Uncharacterized protein n=1 Tax=Algimonas porphyrae TaxID=1128113 RepID=A0ABQ5V127_9PROT|nr:hypothetical protein [Algimonas porphyrae]GLQ20498.1 hypothetical protein GCM10007854_14530 [Algimonas porphyrae]
MALTKRREIVSRKPGLVAHPVAATAVIHSGAIVVLNGDDFAQPGTAAAGLRSVGRAIESCDNSAGGNGDARITVQRDLAQRYDNDGVAPVTREHIGGSAYIVDDHTVSSDATDRSAVGIVLDVDEDGVWILFP